MSIRNTIIDNLISELDDLKTVDYEADIKKITPFVANYLTEPSSNTPMLMVTDEGNDTLLTEDPTHVCFAFNVTIYGFINKDIKYEKTQEELNEITASIKQWINSGPSLGDNVYAIQFVECTGNSYDDQGKALTGVRTRILYWCVKGTY